MHVDAARLRPPAGTPPEGVIVMWFDGVVPDREEPGDVPGRDQADSIWSTDDVPVPGAPLDTAWPARTTSTDEPVSLAPLRPTLDEHAASESATAPQPRSLRSKLLIGGGVLVAFAFVVAAIVRSGDDEGAVPNTTVAETRASTTSDAPTTTDEARDASAEDAIGNGVDTTAPIEIELPPAVATIQSPTEVIALTDDGVVHTLSLPSGRVRSVALTDSAATEMFGGGGPVVVAPGGSAINESDGSGVVLVPRAGPPVSVGADELGGTAGAFQVMGWWRAGDGTERFVVAIYPSTAGDTTFASVGLDGDVVPLLAPQAVASGFGLTTPDGTWIVNATGGAYEVDPNGTSRRIDNGEVLAAAGDHLLVRDCDESLRCSTVLVRRSDGERRVIDPALLPDGFENMMYGVSVSPDGSAMSATRYGTDREERTIIDLGVGEVAAAPIGYGAQGSTWAPDSSGIFESRPSGPGLQFIARTGETAAFGEELGQVVAVGVRWPDAELDPTVTVVSESVSAARPLGPTGITLIGALREGGMSYIDIDAGVAQSWATTQPLGEDLTLVKGGDALLALGKSDIPAFAFRGGVQEPLDEVFAVAGVKLPGPVDGSIWVPAPELGASPGGVAYRLVTIDGRPIDAGGATIDLPDAELIGSDGSGGLVVARGGDVFTVGVDGADRLTTGDLIAIGPDTAYVRECTAIDACDITRIDRRTGDRSTPETRIGPDTPPTNDRLEGAALGTSVSPDGDVLLMELQVASTDAAGDTTTVERWAFADTARGQLTFIDDFDAGQPVVWSADSSFAAVLVDSTLSVFDRAAGELVPLSTRQFRAIGSAASPFPTPPAD